jgi:hypothetical protein
MGIVLGGLGFYSSNVEIIWESEPCWRQRRQLFQKVEHFVAPYITCTLPTFLHIKSYRKHFPAFALRVEALGSPGTESGPGTVGVESWSTGYSSCMSRCGRLGARH